MSSQIIPSFTNGFYSPWRSTGEALHPNLWWGCIGAWNPVIGPTGSTLLDWSGRANHGTLTNMDPATDWIASQYGWVLDLDGTSDRILVNGSSSLLNTSTGSMTIWAIHKANAQHSVFEYGRSGSTAEVIGIRRTSTTQTDMRYRESNTNYDVSFTTISDDVWYHYAITWSGGTVNGYLDGVAGTPVTSVPAIGTINQGVIGTTAQGTIGISRDFLGSFFDARLYNRALSANEINTLARDPHAPYRVKRRRRAVIAAAAPGGFTAAFASRSNVLIQPHVTA